jgi:hypothetical protein
MEQPAPKQRSPWVYVLLGCGGFAALSCFGLTLVFGFGAKKLIDVTKGVSDPQVRVENAKTLMGVLPVGYEVAATMMLGVVNVAVLTDGAVQPDGGVELGAHVFTFYRVMANPENQRTKSFFTSGSGSLKALSGNLSIDARDIVKRGSFTVNGRKLYYVASRGPYGANDQQNEARDGLNASVLFDCPGDVLYVGIWSMQDPFPEKAVDQIDGSGTVIDEMELSKFIEPINPCGR